MTKAAIPLGLRVGNPFLLHWFLQYSAPPLLAFSSFPLLQYRLQLLVKLNGAELKEQEVREKWERQLASQGGIRDANTLDDLWEEAKNRDLLENVYTHSWMVEDLVDHSKVTLRWWRNREGRSQAVSRARNKEPIRVFLNDIENERKAALEEYLAMCAACDIDVYRFREKVLEGQPLAENEARELLKSPAAALIGTRLFKGWKVPIAGHSAEVISYERVLIPPGFEEYTATIVIDPPGITRTVGMPTLANIADADEQRPVVLEFPDEESRIVGREVWSTSLLGELRKLGEKLSERYRWQPAQAVWFVLTGEIPAIPALTVTRSFPSSMYHSDTLITVEASPWVSSKTVERAFRKAQIKTLGSSGGRPPSEKNLKLLRFVIERIEHLGTFEEGKMPPEAPDHMVGLELVAQYPWYRKMPNGKELVGEWNETYPQWSYGDDTRRFWRDYKRIKKIIAFGPPYE